MKINLLKCVNLNNLVFITDNYILKSKLIGNIKSSLISLPHINKNSSMVLTTLLYIARLK